MANHIVYITQGRDKLDTSVETQVLGPNVDLRVIASNDPYEIGKQAGDADAMLVWRTPIPAQALGEMKRCKVIVRIGIGYDIVDIDAARANGIPVCNVPDYGTDDVADHTMALILSLRRGLSIFSDSVRAGNDGWSYTAAGPLSRLTGQILGIVGFGRIGTAVAIRAKAFGLHVKFFDPYTPAGQEKAIGVERVHNLEELLQSSDIVSLHTPLTEETRLMANASFFAELKHGAIIINTSRGGVLDTEALEAAMRVGVVGAAGLDVWPTEPPAPVTSLMQAWRDGEEWVKNRLIATPHSAFYNTESYHEMRFKAAQTVRDVLSGMPPRNCVNC